MLLKRIRNFLEVSVKFYNNLSKEQQWSQTENLWQTEKIWQIFLFLSLCADGHECDQENKQTVLNNWVIDQIIDYLTIIILWRRTNNKCNSFNWHAWECSNSKKTNENN